MRLVDELLRYFGIQPPKRPKQRFRVVVWQDGERHELTFLAEDPEDAINQLWVKPIHYSVSLLT